MPLSQSLLQPQNPTSQYSTGCLPSDDVGVVFITCFDAFGMSHLKTYLVLEVYIYLTQIYVLYYFPCLNTTCTFCRLPVRV